MKGLRGALPAGAVFLFISFEVQLEAQALVAQSSEAARTHSSSGGSLGEASRPVKEATGTECVGF